MALLAGDDIVGATEEYLEQVLDVARLEQEPSAPMDGFLLDATSLTAASAARMVLDLTAT